MRATFDHTDTLRPDVLTFWFRPDTLPRFEPGQFTEIRLPHADVDSRSDRREFSISSQPGEPLIAITTNFAATNGSSFKRALRKLQPGDTITYTEPMGDFVLPKDPSIPLVFVAVGIGSVPYAAMVQWLLDHHERRPIQLVYAESKPTEFLYGDLWQRYSLERIPIVSQPVDGWSGLTGRVTAGRLLKIIGPLKNKLIYSAGPQSFIEPFYGSLLDIGIPRGQLLLDYFSGY